MTDRSIISEYPRGVGAEASTLEKWLDYITRLLGREPRGLRAIAAWNGDGQPAVIRVASLVGGKPFPTLFWLIDPEINLKLDRLEARGVIAEFQAQVNASPELRAAMAEDHRLHKSLRDSFLTDEERQYLAAKGMIIALDNRGIGGIAGTDRIRCLHTWYAAHLVEPNTIGRLTDQLLQETH